MGSKKNILSQLRTLLIYAIIFALMLYVYNWHNEAIKESFNLMQRLVVSPIIIIFFGILLSFERIIEVRHSIGDRKFNWVRFLIVVLPLTILSFFYALGYIIPVGRFPMAHSITPTMMNVAQVMQGFLFVSCFTKVKNSIERVEEGAV